MFSTKPIAAVLMTVTILSATTGICLAAKDTAPENVPKVTTPSIKKPTAEEYEKADQMQSRIRNALDGLVKEGIITQEQENSVIKALMLKRKKSHEHKHGILKDLVKDGTLTKEQADAVRDAIRQSHDR